MRDLILKAQNFAHYAHDHIGQKRKYTGLPYWTHTDEVASLVEVFSNDEEVIAAAHLHDIREDVETIDDYLVNKNCLVFLFGERVYDLVTELTDIYTKEVYKTLNRKERKNLESNRLSAISEEGKIIKLADIYSNSEDIVIWDKEFAVKYLEEKGNILNLFRMESEKGKELFKLVKAQYENLIKILQCQE